MFKRILQRAKDNVNRTQPGLPPMSLMNELKDKLKERKVKVID